MHFAPIHANAIWWPLDHVELNQFDLAKPCATTLTVDSAGKRCSYLWGQASNLMMVPSDCDNRDERFGWTGDSALTADEASSCSVEQLS